MPNSSMAKTKGGSRRALVVAGILLAIPFFAYIVLPLYDRVKPELAGLPFFYWYQILWLGLSALFFGIAGYLIARNKRGDSE
jgi:hypothetical protein